MVPSQDGNRCLDGFLRLHESVWTSGCPYDAAMVYQIFMTTRKDRLQAVLTAAFAPTSLEVTDDSSRHAGHSGSAPGGETHYTVRMVSAMFAGQSRLMRSRAVHESVVDEFRDGLHALSLVLRSPNEA